LNFFGETGRIFDEVRRVAASGAVFICSVPVVERNRLGSKIRGTLHSEPEYEGLCRSRGDTFEPAPVENGALLYFKSTILKREHIHYDEVGG
jgi:hypothetical protein